METTPLPQVGYEFCVSTLKLKEGLESGFLSLAQRLLRIRDERLYDPQWQSFGEYLNELKITESKASKLISVFQRFVLEYNIDETKLLQAGGWSNLYELLRLAKSKEEAEAWIDRRIGAFEPHFREEIRLAKKGLEECAHEFYSLRVCTKCNYHEKLQQSA